ncbi:PAS domain S-box protein [Antrihabitans cavernicola]|nr:PAS domain S-box protein [Spelaeibacter cavernicola]
MLQSGIDPGQSGEGTRPGTEDIYSSLIERLDLAVAVTNIEGEFVSLNHAFADLLGFTVNEARRYLPSDIVHPDCRHDLERETQQLIDGTVDTVTTYRKLVRRDGTVLHARVHKTIARRGPATVIMTVFDDFTDVVWEYPQIADRGLS